jgi:cytochrome P450
VSGQDEIEVLGDLAYDLPLYVISELLGVAVQDRPAISCPPEPSMRYCGSRRWCRRFTESPPAIAFLADIRSGQDRLFGSYSARSTETRRTLQTRMFSTCGVLHDES